MLSVDRTYDRHCGTSENLETSVGSSKGAGVWWMLNCELLSVGSREPGSG